jgi:hypothetical protein
MYTIGSWLYLKLQTCAKTLVLDKLWEYRGKGLAYYPFNPER